MTTATRLTAMRVVDVHPEIREEKQKSIIAAWAFIHAALFKNEVYTEKEILNFHFLLGEHYDPAVCAEKNFTRIAVRVMLVKRYMQRNPFYHLPHPALWLNKNYSNGFGNTKLWYDNLIEKRKLVAAYEKPLFVLARGVYRYSQAPVTDLFCLYRDKLLHLKACECLSVFYTAALFQNHLTR